MGHRAALESRHMARSDGARRQSFSACAPGPGFAGRRAGSVSAPPLTGDFCCLFTDQEVLLELEREGILVFTPSRVVDGKRITCYDDR